jgi:hypothetical protein
VLSTSSFALKDAVHVYPNPSHGDFTIEINDGSLIQKMELLDAHGKWIQQLNKAIVTQFVFHRNVQSGIYFIRLTNDNATDIKRLIIG